MTGKKLLHTRTYDVEAYVEDDRHLRLVGRMHDVRPDGLWGIVDIEPMSLHDMRIELVIDAVTFEITAVETAMVTHPHQQCPLILPVFQQLVGTSIARGFGSRVKSLFGGPRSCTHFVALLNAMAPAAMQARWSFFHATSDGAVGLLAGDTDARREGMRAGQEANRDTCHMWATGGPNFALLDAGQSLGPPLWAADRLAERGIPLSDWVTFG